MTHFRFLPLLALCLGLAFVSACVKQPTRSEDTVDLRPAISFTLKSETQIAANYHVFIDQLHMGTADKYLKGQAALRVLPGSHIVQLKLNGNTVLEQKIYLGDGAVKHILLP